MGMVDFVGRAPSRAKLLRGEIPDWIRNSDRGPYIAQVVLSAPPWVDRRALMALKQRCIWTSVMTGVEHHLDHIVPLQHPRVCGLTVPWNLRIVPAKVNISRGNYWCPEQMELFDDSHHHQAQRGRRRRAQRDLQPVRSLPLPAHPLLESVAAADADDRLETRDR